jgi:transposase-like protein
MMKGQVERPAACSHPRLEKERYLGAQTGDYVCTSCKKTFTEEEAERIEEERERRR